MAGYGVPIDTKLLITGGIGMGKTYIAESIASDLDMTLYKVNPNMIYDDCSNLYKVFNMIRNHNGVYLFDDAYDWMTGACAFDIFRHFMKDYKSQSIIITCMKPHSSREFSESLYSCFDVCVKLEKPSKEAVRNLISSTLGHTYTAGTDDVSSKVVDMAFNMSYKKIVHTCHELMRNDILYDGTNHQTPDYDKLEDLFRNAREDR